MTEHLITDLASLEALYGPVAEASIAKETNFLHPIYRSWIETARFAVLATSGPASLDVSPRGDPGQLLRVVDENTILMPERRGNNRIDTLRNIVYDSRIALILLIPGVGETMRISGQALISVAPDLLESFKIEGKPPHCVLQIKVQKVFFQCARAVVRSGLWKTQEHNISQVPTAGSMLASVSRGRIDGQAYDSALPQRLRETLY
jgi:PPOX class probable FMN-dependent enzyme